MTQKTETDVVEIMLHTLCRHLREARMGSRAPCRKCPPFVETDYGEGVNLCYLQARDAARACLTALSEAGFAIVPVEPTQAMKGAAFDVEVWDNPITEDKAAQCWSAMLAAVKSK